MILEHLYSKGVFEKKIFILGMTPPPLGGISVHILRTIKVFEKHGNFVKTLDVVKESNKRSKFSYLFFLFKSIIKFKPDIIYYHTLSLRKLPFEFALLLFLKITLKAKLILINHTPRFFYEKNWIYKKTINMLLPLVDTQVLIGNSTHNAYIENDIYLSKKISIESPYLPPDIIEADKVFEKYPDSLKDFLNNHSPIILINGSAVREFKNIDLYGFDMAVELIKNLKHQYLNCGLIIVIAEKGEIKLFNKLMKLIENHKNIYMLFGCSHEIWPLFKRIDLFIRPTCSDAYGISIQEALEMNVKVVASNVCQRPKGSILFESRNQHELNEKVKLSLTNISSFKKNICK